MSGVLAAIGFAPSITGPTAPAPAPNPFALAVLGFVRRELEQFQRTYFNRTPDAINDSIGIPEVTPITFDPRANDVDRDRGDTLTVTAVTDGTYGTVTNNGDGTVTYTPNAETNALALGETLTDTFTYTVSDANSPQHLHGLFGFFGRGHTDTATVSVTITGDNDTPDAIADVDPVAIGEDDAARVIDVLGNDSDPDTTDTLTVTAVTNGTYGTVTNNGDGTVNYTPNAAANALAAGDIRTDTFTYSISDGNGGADTASVSVTVTGANDAPEAVADTIVDPIGEDEGARVIDVLGNDTDPDALETLTVTAVTNGTYGTVTTNGDRFVDYTPNATANALAAGDARTDTFTYTISDSNGVTDTATVSVTVTGANDTPDAVADTVADPIDEDDGARVIDVLGNDSDPDTTDTLTVTAVTNGTYGDVTTNGDGTVNYTPNAAANALTGGDIRTDTFTYSISDGNGGTDTASVSVTVTGSIDATVISTGEHSPTDLELGLDGDFGYIRNEDGTLTEIEYDDDAGWVVGADVDADIDAGALALDDELAYAYDREDDALAVIDLETGLEVDRVGDVGDVTDVALDRRVEGGQVDRVYTVDSDGTVLAIDARSGTVVGRQRTGIQAREAAALVAADATAVIASPKLAVAPGGNTIYVANGNRISVVKRQTAVAARLASEGDEAVAEVNELVYDDSLDLSLAQGEEVTALEASDDGSRLYATVVSTDASGRAVSRLVAINVDEASGMLTRGESVAVGSDARSIAINDDLDRGYVVSAEDQTMSVVDLRRLEVLDVVQTGVAAGVAVAPGTNTVLITNPNINAISVANDTTVNPDAPITITLDWGLQPRDLDAHLVGDTDDGTFHVSYLDETWEIETSGGTAIGAFLDIDDTDGDGPEVIELNTRSQGTYLFYVDNFSNDGGLTASSTTVTIWDQSTGQKLGEFEVPTEGSGRYWAVFNIDVSESGTVTITPRTDGVSPAVPPLDPPPPPTGSAVDL